MREDDLRRLARRTRFNLATLEKDYALTWLLSGLYSEDSELKDVLIFKGGTAIRKVYFVEWRLSEDLDFTIAQTITPQEVRDRLEHVFPGLGRKSNISYSIRTFHSSPRSIQTDVQFVGPLRFRNRIAHDISLNERLVDELELRTLRSGYADIPNFEVLVYSLNEILVEKIRSILQRGKARDYYDVWRLPKQHDFEPDRISEQLMRKCELTGVDSRPQRIFDDTRLGEAEKFWTISLSRLTTNLPAFDTVIGELRTKLAFLG